MPFRRSNRNRRRRSRNTGTRSKRRMTKSRSVYKQPMTAYKVQRIISAELKRTVFGVSGDAPALTGEIQNLTNSIPQGDLATQRNGNWIQPIVMHGTLRVNALHVAAIPNLPVVSVRASFFRWKEDNSTNLPTLDEIVNDTSAPNGHFNFPNRGMFDILWTRNFTLVPDERNPQFTKMFKYYIKLNRGQKVIYDDALPKKYQLFFIIFSDTVDVTLIPEYRFDNVIRFTDS